MSGSQETLSRAQTAATLACQYDVNMKFHEAIIK